MTFEELKKSKKEFLIPREAADILGCDPYKINVQARKDPSKLGFPVTIIGSRVKIPRRAFIRWMEGN